MKHTKHLLTSAYLSGVIFAALACPLLWMGNKYMTVELDNETVVASSVRQTMNPYLLACSVLGGSIGVASFALGSWRDTAQQNARLKAETMRLNRDLKTYQQELEDVLLYNNRLQSMALDGIFPDTATAAPEIEDVITTIDTASPTKTVDKVLITAHTH